YTCVEQDKLAQAFEDAVEVLGFSALPSYRNYLAFIKQCTHIRGHPKHCGVLPAEEPVRGWRTVVTAADFYFEGNNPQSPRTITKSHLGPPAEGGTGCYCGNTFTNPCAILRWHLGLIKTKTSFSLYQKKKKPKENLLNWKEKDNGKTMTYQKMGRALRNYARTKEITKIQRMLAYQFSEAVLQSLSLPRFLGKEIYSQSEQPGQEYPHLNSGYNTYIHGNVTR
uniref:ETS domain-containing protein n=1 Tax=Castor canadensis TaxID=51338 RepID=A0A8C0XCA5_CASCN